MHAVLGLAEHHAGRLAVYGDSNCLDSSHQRTPCYALLLKLARWATEVLPPARHGDCIWMLGACPGEHLSYSVRTRTVTLASWQVFLLTSVVKSAARCRHT